MAYASNIRAKQFFEGPAMMLPQQMLENYTTVVKVTALQNAINCNTTAAAHNSYLAFRFMPIANESLKIPTRNVEWRQRKHTQILCEILIIRYHLQTGDTSRISGLYLTNPELM
jgi:hypothetical protein